MSMRKVICHGILFSLLGGALLSGAAQATAYNVDPNASTVKLRTSCIEGSAPSVTLNNCFDDTQDLIDWISYERLPGPANPLVVEIGPGTFSAFALNCVTGNGTTNSPLVTVFPGYVSFRGMGVKQTIFQTDFPNSQMSLAFKGCNNMSFSDFAFNGFGYAYIAWDRGGSSTWNNVEVNGRFYAWREESCAATPGSHYWFSSRLISTIADSGGQTAYLAKCDNSWFFGSEITLAGGSGSVINTNREVHVYGSVIRALTTFNATAAYAYGSGEIHLHGTGIDMLSTAASNFVALHAQNTARIHADSSAYNLSTGAGGSITRILDQTTSGHGVHAPYLWHGHDTPPSIITENGADVAVVNDPTGPRFVIYNSACSSKWYDVGNNACRP
ncbi:MAG: hypothetical protein Tsb0026_20750 [Sulfuricaulis sp.]